MPILQVSTRRPRVSCKRWPGRRCRTIIRSDFEFVRAGDYFDKILRGTGAFSSEVDTGSREENASKQEIEPRSDSIGTEKALGSLNAKRSSFTSERFGWERGSSAATHLRAR